MDVESTRRRFALGNALSTDGRSDEAQPVVANGNNEVLRPISITSDDLVAITDKFALAVKPAYGDVVDAMAYAIRSLAPGVNKLTADLATLGRAFADISRVPPCEDGANLSPTSADTQEVSIRKRRRKR